MSLDFQKYIDAALGAGAPKEIAENFVKAIREIESSGKVIDGLEDVSPQTYTIQPLKILMNGNKLGIYTGKEETAEFGTSFSFVPLRITKYKVIWSAIDNKVVQRIYPRDVVIPEREGHVIYPITAIFGITQDFRHLFVIEGIRTKIDPVNSLINDLKANVKGKTGIYELLAQAKVVTKRSGKIQYKTIDLTVAGDLDERLRELAKLASRFVLDYIEYRRNKPVQLVSDTEAGERIELMDISEEAKVLEGF